MTYFCIIIIVYFLNNINNINKYDNDNFINKKYYQ